MATAPKALDDMFLGLRARQGIHPPDCICVVPEIQVRRWPLNAGMIVSLCQQSRCGLSRRPDVLTVLEDTA
jgi:hypothetical protein